MHTIDYLVKRELYSSYYLIADKVNPYKLITDSNIEVNNSYFLIFKFNNISDHCFLELAHPVFYD